MAGFAFRATEEANTEITRLFDFVWPTSIALWNLRWQVDGFLRAVPDASFEDVASRFVAGSCIRGADIRAMSKNTSWEEQKTRFSEFVLTNIFAVYESWARSILRNTGTKGVTDKDLYREGDGSTTGLSFFVAETNRAPSAVMQSAFQPAYLAHRKYSPAYQRNHLKCYRYFKQLRNCQIHNGGIADQVAVNAYLDFLPVSNSASLNMKGDLEHFAVVLNGKIPISLRGVVGFCDVVRQLMITVDAQISGSKAAEKFHVEKIKEKTNRYVLTLKSDPNGAARQIEGICKKARLPKPKSLSELTELLLQQKIVSR